MFFSPDDADNKSDLIAKAAKLALLKVFVEGLPMARNNNFVRKLGSIKEHAKDGIYSDFSRLEEPSRLMQHASATLTEALEAGAWPALAMLRNGRQAGSGHAAQWSPACRHLPCSRAFAAAVSQKASFLEYRVPVMALR